MFVLVTRQDYITRRDYVIFLAERHMSKTLNFITIPTLAQQVAV